MILFFTGTGNSRFVAEFIADRTGDECVSLNDVLKYKKPLKFASERPFVVVAPIYAWGFPNIIIKLVKRAEFIGNSMIYFIGTMGSQTGDADRELEKLAGAKGMDYMGFCGVAMPNNYIDCGNIPDTDKAEERIRESIPLMREISDRIMAKVVIEKRDSTPFSSVASGVVNKGFNRFFIKGRKFKVGYCCVGCGVCAKVCPVNNIRIVNGAPVFSEYCLSCYSCIHHCPEEALNIGWWTEVTNRYVCPEFSDWKKRGLA